MREFRVTTKVDSPVSCACGQAKADNIIPGWEQAIALTMMTGNGGTVAKLGDKHGAFTAKLGR